MSHSFDFFKFSLSSALVFSEFPSDFSSTLSNLDFLFFTVSGDFGFCGNGGVWLSEVDPLLIKVTSTDFGDIADWISDLGDTVLVFISAERLESSLGPPNLCNIQNKINKRYERRKNHEDIILSYLLSKVLPFVSFFVQ